MATMMALIVHNVFKQAGLRLGTGVSLFEWRYLRVYVVIVLCALELLAFQLATSAWVYVSLDLAIVATLSCFGPNSKMLAVREMFPEAMRFPGVASVGVARSSANRGCPPYPSSPFST